MKTILTPISNGFFPRNFLRAGFLDFFKNRTTRFIFVVPKEKLSYYEKEFIAPNISFVEAPPVSRPCLERFFRELETASIPTRTMYLMHLFHFRRRGTKQRFLPRLLIFSVKMFFWSLGHFSFWRWGIRFLYGFFEDSAHGTFLSGERPDLVFAPTMVYGSEWIFLREAIRQGITTIGMTSSWDNLYAKNMFRVKPSRLLVQTELMKRTATELYGYPSEKIIVTGVPQYDRFFKKLPIDSRGEFFRLLGGDKNKKTILYAFSGKITAELDNVLMKEMAKAIKRGEFGSNVQLLVRPYPKRDFSPEKAEKLSQEFGILIRPSVTHVGEGKNAWEFDEASLRFLAGSIFHSDVVVTACSTFIVESAVFDKPIISIAFDFPKELDYPNSARRFFDWNHLRDIKSLHGVRLTQNLPDLFSATKEYLADPLRDSKGRKEIVAQQCSFTDGLSVMRVAEAIKR